ncbi:uncharacterized protein MONOS_16803 [Monocercomonoides exilis]|uniref:uncharacterized protein n=1 Tax=Monocercomonoides exilis TaxID=2049356 RepID=UPI00355A63EF|nr:hypothetical protein MONOS_16803 [Monocercomonoides exilis]|eukprot:MONOS_16803.1-p1 / transcript=MONOS_16803.1 / gene=MONOS_16803 / organism=Monocercomonoides_exilis_PA203 / gene_product=unspecified product / transcript_product=unspecified product / location=Mono_scaffold00054:132515-132772(+) / protein_length=86 / sequence_SO=supercontig / SO=protein_coding / is_pseudo=false
MHSIAFILIALAFISDTYAGRFTHRKKEEKQIADPAEKQQKQLKPNLVNSAKRFIQSQDPPLVNEVKTPFVAHAIEMKNHKPKLH